MVVLLSDDVAAVAALGTISLLHLEHAVLDTPALLGEGLNLGTAPAVGGLAVPQKFPTLATFLFCECVVRCGNRYLNLFYNYFFNHLFYRLLNYLFNNLFYNLYVIFLLFLLCCHRQYWQHCHCKYDKLFHCVCLFNG